jgi:hypothetical protein
LAFIAAQMNQSPFFQNCEELQTMSIMIENFSKTKRAVAAFIVLRIVIRDRCGATVNCS